MNLKSRLGYAVSIIGISLSGSAVADLYVYGHSSLNSSNSLNITTSSGDFFVPITDSGWWTSDFGHDASNKNYFAGHGSTATTGNHNNYFTFDLSGISGTITSASFNLFTYTVAGSSVDYQLFDVTSPLSEVHATGTNAAVYDDLMTGVSYGSFIYNSSDSNEFRSILLNADGISALNSAIGGEFGIGGTITGGIEGPSPPQIPEPETYAMWLAGLGLLGFLRYRRKNPNINSPVH
ncbi:putative secreted protein with PEP-CTERM sorting signal/MYXO-CTERM domain-containing protein [Nitrosomonas sp. Nm84]|uniref:PEP-CTERM sorting domain-containing protein n=1 Tax=Nitrosomonas sp. Nm84 TaxID=200124 RepID=UPI000D7647D6|nr:PEP-CTERM sorting domain-containing protein [Nitrosomonas sp. Nm84]PXW89665.1 putative secreted protein with PEP-CTERM sorting signal/MYXO-CTERM domain-containing protein [Nitrosomonas sp. Nm84]